MAEKINPNNKAARIIEQLRNQRGVQRSFITSALNMTTQDLGQILNKGQDMKTEKFIAMVESLGFAISIEQTDVYRLAPEVYDRTVDAGTPDGKFFCVTDTEVKAASIAGGNIYQQSFPIGESENMAKENAADFLRSV